MFEEAVGHLAQAEAHVLEADFLADDVERHRRETAVHLAHDAREHRAVAHAGIEQAHRRRPRMDLAELEPDAPRDHVLLAAGIDEEQVLLAVVEEAEVGFRIGLRCGHRGMLRGTGMDQRHQLRRRIADARAAMLRYEIVDAGEGLGGDARPVAQPRDELAVVDGAAAESRFGHARAPAKIRDASQKGTGSSPALYLQKPSSVTGLRENLARVPCGTSTTPA